MFENGSCFIYEKYIWLWLHFFPFHKIYSHTKKHIRYFIKIRDLQLKIDILSHKVTSNECIAGNGYIPERSDTSEYIKEWYQGSVSLR